MSGDHRRRCPTRPFLGALTVLGACWGGLWASASEPATLEFEIVWVDLAAVGPALIEGAGAELRDMLAPLGLRVAWRIETPGVAFPTGHAIVHLMPSNPNPAQAGRPVGGAVGAAPEATHDVWIFPVRVANGLGLTMERVPWWTVRERCAFARALSVVVAHELAHSVARAGHTPGGVMAQRLCSRQLRDRSPRMDVRLAPDFRAALAAPPTPAP